MNGATIYRGNSRINGKGVEVKVSGLFKGSGNVKTGKGPQVAILPIGGRAVVALRDGNDESVCGSCPLRAGPDGTGRLCYVNPMYVNTISKQDYPIADPNDAVAVPIKGLLRIGSYGDPGAVPLNVYEPLIERAEDGHTGYTRRWRELGPNAPERAYLMASVFTEAEAREAWALGWRTFRPMRSDETPIEGEIVCPHVTHGTTCADCRLCDGKNGADDARKSIANPIHGARNQANLDAKFREIQDLVQIAG